MQLTAPRLLLIVFAAAPIQAQSNGSSAADQVLQAETYVKPPAAIERLVDAPRHLNVALTNQSPSRRHFLETQSSGMPSVREFGKPWYNLGGLQVDPRGNRARTLTTRSALGFEIIDATTGRTVKINAPTGSTVSGARWSPDGTQLAFIANFDDASHIYVADVATGNARRVTSTPILATFVTEPLWTGNGNHIATVLIPANRGAEPRAPAIATGPKVRMTKEGFRHRTRTYADLLEWPHERDLVEYFTTGQLATIDVRSRAIRRIGAPTMIQQLDPSPTGNYFRVTIMQKPFSHTVPVSAFGTTQEVWDATGKPVIQLASRPLPEGDADDDDDAPAANRAQSDTAKRNVEWMATGDVLYFLQMDAAQAQAQAAGEDASAPSRTRARDRVFQWSAPFSAESRKAIFDNTNRMSQVAFSGDGKTLFVAENASGTAHVFAVDLADASKRYTLTRMRGLTASLGIGGGGFGGGGGGGANNRADSATFYQNPGTLVADRMATGTPYVLTSPDGRYAYLNGVQYYRTWLDSAPQPFLERVEIRTGTKTRLFQSARDQYEQVVAPLDANFDVAIISRESPKDVPDYFRRDMKTGTLTQLTQNKDYSPEITNAQRQLIPVTRADGYRFNVNVTLPADWKPGTRLPALFWFYPREFTDQSGYDRTLRTFNRNRFPNLGPRSMVYMITQGYAVVEPDAPIFGEPGRMNDNYVPDLRNNLAAVIDELDSRGIIDRQRLALGGHSYGAFSTVNAMVHTPFFKAGIAGDGNYNRTLTPNAFQSERRVLWEARETYLSMSPFMYADRLTGALLMYHNLEDQNVGTDPINSVRLFHALQGMGKPVALYMHPYEDHGQATRETNLDLWARWVAWLDKYLKPKNGKIAD
ncbi:MAG TPA: prolyl oligopeptidase family serine peptidase [Gemmatimonadaceae bacterium]|nr:prolyl oligopeptidase family serine peptidase [Gemmatimonadaceae bacterium]